jgi:ectoine hydroxylase-related dioxygenase (phytanoyl-CoA dioxygenase family)
MADYPTFAADQEAEILAYFKENGFAVIENSMSAEDVGALNEFMDRSQVERPDEWGADRGGMRSHGQILVDHPELDGFVQSAATYGLLHAILGDGIRFAQFDFREAPDGSGMDIGMGWHQDGPQVDAENWDPEHPYKCRYGCSIHYLTDVTDEAPCFAVVPDSTLCPSIEAAQKKKGDAFQMLPLRGPAGTGIIYNIATLHTRLAGTTDIGRRTQHTYFSMETSAALTKWVLIPERLAKHEDPAQRAFYSQWTPATEKWAEGGFGPRP